MNFTKMQGAGNDFVLVETEEVDRDWSQMAAAMCDRHFGIGADGLIVLLPSKNAQFRMREFNTDGSEAEACGNGLRCLARYIVYQGLTGAKTKEIVIETMAGLRKVNLLGAGDEVSIQVSLGKPRFMPEEVPVAIGRRGADSKIMDYPVTIDDRQLAMSFVSMGNPHAVHFVHESVSEFPLSQLGPLIEHHQLFPNRTNFEVARVIDRGLIEARVWERGVGETLACGSGACAIAVIAQLHGYIDHNVHIKLPGGILNVAWDGVGEALLSGPAEVVFTGNWTNEVGGK
ncbi:MAG: diaminopimelate epimerase [Chloroflexi bacterium]|nr:diaminopimelate epimerase [Chloroflexota bacterium]